MRSLSLLLVTFAVPVRPVCYYPNGDVSTQDLPCNDGDEASFCCGPGLACLSNKLCMATGSDIQSPSMQSTYVRGTCTDESWRSGNCPNYCVDDKVDQLGHGMPIERCEGDAELYYCVNKEKEDCAKRSNVLVFQSAPSTITTIGISPTSTSISSPSESQTDTPQDDSSEGGSADSSSSDDSGGSGSGSGLSRGATIGVGVGVGVGGALAILGAVAFILIRRRNASAKPAKKPRELPTHEPTGELIGDEPTRKIELDSEQSPPSELEARESPGHWRT